VISGMLNYKQGVMKPEGAGKGEWMCEPALWTHWTHCGTAKAEHQTRLLVLDADKFQRIICTFPTDHAGQYAQEFVQELNKEDHDDLSDLNTVRDRIENIIDVVFPTNDLDAESEDIDGESSGEDPQGRSSSRDGNTAWHPFSRTTMADVVERFSFRPSVGSTGSLRRGSARRKSSKKLTRSCSPKGFSVRGKNVLLGAANTFIQRLSSAPDSAN